MLLDKIEFSFIDSIDSFKSNSKLSISGNPNKIADNSLAFFISSNFSIFTI